MTPLQENTAEAPCNDSKRQELEAAVSAHYDRLLQYALKLTRNVADAEDLVQDTMIHAMSGLHSYKANTQMKQWLFRIALNTFINGYRRQQRFAEIKGALNNMVESGLNFTSGQMQTDRSNEEISPLVEQALEAMPDQFRLVLALRAIHDMTYREIAQIVEVPIGTVMSQLFRGRNAMQTDEVRNYARSEYGMEAK